MPELAFQVRGADPVSSAISPTIAIHTDIISDPPEQPIQSVLLNYQIQIEAPKRRYVAAEQSRLLDLFGEAERWGQTLRSLLWANLTTNIPGFTGAIGVDLMAPCTLDFNDAAVKYFNGVDDAAVPVSLHMSGTIFYRADGGLLQAAPIPWNTEARFTMSAAIWKQCIDLHCPNTSWIALRRDNFERLRDFQVRHGLPTFDAAIERALEAKA